MCVGARLHADGTNKMTKAKARRTNGEKKVTRFKAKAKYKAKYKQQREYKRCRYGEDTWARVAILYILRHCNRLLKFGAIQFSCLFVATLSSDLPTYVDEGMMRKRKEIIDIISFSALPLNSIVTVNLKRQHFFFLMSAFLTTEFVNHIANDCEETVGISLNISSASKCLT